jgi:hypothetical protein
MMQTFQQCCGCIEKYNYILIRTVSGTLMPGSQFVYLAKIDKKSNLKTRARNPLWRLAEALRNTSEIWALIGCFQVLIIIQTVGLCSDSNIV